MRISGLHTTRYRYSKPVFLEPHVFRFRPRDDGAQRLLQYSLEISPAPAGRVQCLDADDNVVVHAWFEGLVSELEIRSAFSVETLRSNPFDFLIAPGSLQLPPADAPPAIAALAPYLEPPPHAVREFARGLAGAAGGRTLEFLALLNRTLYGGFRYQARDLGAAHPPAWTLHHRCGSCRDFAVLFAAAARAVGIAARFVSGYHAGEASERTSMHAWAEVYIEGGGWRGYDPAHGLAASLDHVAVAASADPQFAAPVTGSLRGVAEAAMEYALAIQAAP